MRLFDVDLSGDFIINSFKYETNSDSSAKRIIIGDSACWAKKPSFKTMDRHKNGLKAINCVQKEKEDEYQSDSSEELQYGPGIVSKLKTRYLSLTLRENQKRGVRPSLSNLRRATSLENVLDDEVKKPAAKNQTFFKKSVVHPSSKNSKVSQYCARYMSINQGNDSIKRAQSMDALYKNDNKAPLIIVEKGSVENRVLNGVKENCSNQEPKVVSNQQENVIKDLPPPDLVKQTLKIFENPMLGKKPEICNKVVRTVKAPCRSIVSERKPQCKPVLLPKPSSDKLLAQGKLSIVKKHLVHCSSPEQGSLEPSTEPGNLYSKTVTPPPLSPVMSNETDKFITSKALDNIAKEGTQFKFSFGNAPLPATKTHLAKQSLTQATNTVLLSQANEKSCVNTAKPESQTSPVKQIAVIRPVQSPTLTNIEIEKNRMNKVISSDVINSVTETSGKNICEHNSVEKISLWDSNKWQNQNTVVFNFSNRKEIPDYIENDGFLFISKENRAKCPGEDSEDDVDQTPGSPCAINIIGGNVLINGKSNLRKEPKQHKLRIQFNDAATTLFEYPREDSEEVSPLSPTTNSPLVPGNGLSSYTPHKSGGGEKFELGVTRCSSTTPPPQPPAAPDDCLKPADAAPWSHEPSADLLF